MVKLNQYPSRRSVIKSLGASATGFMTVPGIASADARGQESDGDVKVIDPQDHKPLYPDESHIRIDDELKELTPHWILLTAPDDVVYKYVDKSTVEDRPLVRESLKSLRRRVNTREYTENGDRVIELQNNVDKESIRRAINNNKTRSRKREKTISSFEDIVRAVYQGWSNSRNNVQSQWRQYHHGWIAWVCADSMGISSDYREKINEEARQPDNDDMGGAPQDLNLSEKEEEYYNKVIHSIKHYWNPEHPDRGEAPENAATHYNYALYRTTKNVSYGATAYASHYVADLAQPLHTGKEIPQADDYAISELNGNTPLHYKYANWTRSNWDDIKSNLQNNYIYDVNDISNGAKDLATTTHQDCDTVWTKLFVMDEAAWKQDDELEKITKNRLAAAGLYIKGMFRNVRVHLN